MTLAEFVAWNRRLLEEMGLIPKEREEA